TQRAPPNPTWVSASTSTPRGHALAQLGADLSWVEQPHLVELLILEPSEHERYLGQSLLVAIREEHPQLAMRVVEGRQRRAVQTDVDVWVEAPLHDELPCGLLPVSVVLSRCLITEQLDGLEQAACVQATAQIRHYGVFRVLPRAQRLPHDVVVERHILPQRGIAVQCQGVNSLRHGR